MQALPLTAQIDDTPDEERAVLTDTELVQFRCARCSFRISLTGPPPSCPMCHTHLWELEARP
jgi:rubrerythrin